MVTHEDLPSDNVVALIEDDQPVLAARRIQHCYEPVALVACADPHRLRRAVQAIHVDIEPLPPVLSIEEALAMAKLWLGQGLADKTAHICTLVLASAPNNPAAQALLAQARLSATA